MLQTLGWILWGEKQTTHTLAKVSMFNACSQSLISNE